MSFLGIKSVNYIVDIVDWLLHSQYWYVYSSFKPDVTTAAYSAVRVAPGVTLAFLKTGI